MAARDVIVASVRDFLRDIQQLNLQKEGLVAVNPSKATYLQSQIWRKFTIIDSLTDSCPGAKKVLEGEILRKRMEFKAEAKDLKTMRVPEAVDAKVMQSWLDAEEGWREGPFEYLQLPPEVRQVVLGFLTCPTDQLNFGQVLPADGQMMGWNENALRFEKVLSVLISRKMLTFNDIIHLILAGDYMQIAASSWFETHLENIYSGNDTVYYSSFADSLLYIDELTIDEFYANPIPGCIQIFFMPYEGDDGDDEVDEAHTQMQFRLLREMGPNIWDCKITIRRITAMQSMTRIRECLALMPNVKYVSLDLFELSDFPNVDAEDISYFDEVELPDLPDLKGLNLGLLRCEGIVAKVLRKYGNQLSQFKTSRFPVDGVPLPRLTVVNVQPSWYRNTSADPLVQIAHFRNLIGSPLKVVHFNIKYDGSVGADFLRSLMSCLNQFRGTLEELDLTFSSENVTGGVADLSWLAHIEFPKVKKLTIWENPGTWNFILHFPALETLTWYYPSVNRFYIFEPGKHFQFSWKEREMRSSSLWKMLPFLKRIEFCFTVVCTVNKVIRTRSEALAYQAKQRGPKPKSKAERRQEIADEGTRKSARIANMKKQ